MELTYLVLMFAFTVHARYSTGSPTSKVDIRSIDFQYLSAKICQLFQLLSKLAFMKFRFNLTSIAVMALDIHRCFCHLSWLLSCIGIAP